MHYSWAYSRENMEDGSPMNLVFLYNINAGGTTLRFILAIINIYPPSLMKVHATGTTL